MSEPEEQAIRDCPLAITERRRGREASAGDSRHLLAVDRLSIIRWLGAAALLLVFAGISGQLMKFLGGHETVYGLVKLFDLDAENNLPSWFSSSLLLITGLLVAFISALKRQSSSADAPQWTVLALVLLYMAADEAASLHEMLNRPMRELLGGQPTGLFHFAWVIPGMALALIFSLWFLKSFLHLPARTRRLAVAAGAVYFGGAIGVELLGAQYVEAHGKDLPYHLIVALEESLEMSGIILFIHTSLQYIEETYGEVRARMTPTQRSGVPDAGRPAPDSVHTGALQPLLTPGLGANAGLKAKSALPVPLIEKLVKLVLTQGQAPQPRAKGNMGVPLRH